MTDKKKIPISGNTPNLAAPALKIRSAGAIFVNAAIEEKNDPKMKLGKYLKRKTLGLYAKMVREKASPEFIARGWAIGMFYGCAIPFGFQLALSIPTALLMRGSKIGAVVGTFITNHFTIFIIYPVQCYVGNKLIGGKLSYGAINDAMGQLISEKSYKALLGLGWELATSFFVGGALMAAVFTPLTYYGVKNLVTRRRARKAKAEVTLGAEGK